MTPVKLGLIDTAAIISHRFALVIVFCLRIKAPRPISLFMARKLVEPGTKLERRLTVPTPLPHT